MRASPVLLAVAGMLAGCAVPVSQTQTVATPPPSVSYQISGNDVSRATAQADGYCQQYGRYANLQGVQPNGPQNVATYTCAGSRASAAAPPYYGSPAPYNAPPPQYGAVAPYNGTPYYGSGPVPVEAMRCAD